MTDSVVLSELEKRLCERLEHLLAESRGPVHLAILSRPSVADGTTVWGVHLPGSGREPIAVILCSSLSAPHMVERSIVRARTAKMLLGPILGAPILHPIDTGELNGLSYAVLPYCVRLQDSRPWWWLQRILLRDVLLEWLWRVSRRTVVSLTVQEVQASFLEPLRLASSLPCLSATFRDAASDAANRLESGTWVPMHVLMHGDFWTGNVLLRPSSRSSHFGRQKRRIAVIDWAGSEPRGYGIYDLVRMARSLSLGDQRLRLEIERHCQVLHCHPIDARCHILTALGHIGMHLEFFPMERYARMAEACLATVDRVVPEEVGKRILRRRTPS